MTHIHPAWLAREQRRWLRLDHARFQNPQYAERKYSPDQPRVPSGNSRGGQWTSERTSGGGLLLPFDLDPEAFAEAGALDGDVDFVDIIEDAPFEEIDSESESLAEESEDLSSVRRRTGNHFVNGQWLEATPAQLARYEVANARAQEAIGRVRELDPAWRPAPSAYGVGIESEINRATGLAAEAQTRIIDLSRIGIGPGPFAVESIPARGMGRNFTILEREEVTRIGKESGCHTCGTGDPGTYSGRFVVDHQLPNALNPQGKAQRLFPQCVSCSARQGGWLVHRGHGR
jgi:hypothetical protein